MYFMQQFWLHEQSEPASRILLGELWFYYLQLCEARLAISFFQLKIHNRINIYR